MLARIERLLSHRRAPLFAMLIAIVLALPAIGAGYMADDHVLRASLRVESRVPGGMMGDWDMFRFQSPDRHNQQVMMDIGVWPWWTAPNLLLGFFRPLAAYWHILDFRLFGELPAIQHAENLVLHGLMALAAAHLYRRLIATAWVAGFAAVMYAADHTHAFPVTWISNRNALIGGAIGLTALVFHDRARRDGDRRAAVIAPLLFAFGMLGGEVTLAALAYLGAHALFLDEAPWRARARALAPYAILVIAWTIVYKALGYGARGGGYYIDPGAEPLIFARAAFTRMPALLLAQLTGPPSDIWSILPESRLAAPLAAAYLVILLMAIPMARVLGRDRIAAFFATGMIVSLGPVCATWPNDRLLLFPGVGAFGLIALFIERVRAGKRAEPGSAEARRVGRGARVLAGAFVFIHAIASPLMLPGRCKQFGDMFSGYVGRGDATMPPTPPDVMVMVLNAPDILITNYVALSRLHRGIPLPKGQRQLAIATDGNEGELTRPDDRALVLTLRDGFFLDPFSRVARGASVPFHQGEVVRLEGAVITVEEVTADGRPKRVRFTFDRPLEDPSLLWVTWKGTGYVRAELPPIGGRAAYPTIDYLAAIYGR